MLLIILKATVSFLSAYWLAAVVILMVGFFTLKRIPIKNWQYFIWIFISAAILSLVFNSTHYFNTYAAMTAVMIQMYKVTIKDNKFYFVVSAFSLGWFPSLIAMLYFRSL